MLHDARYVTLSKEAAKIRSRALRLSVESVIDAGWVNANDTIFLEKVRPITDWDSLFVASMQSALSDRDREKNRHVDAWFEKRGIKF